jgi:hypothetical protein
VTEVSAPGEDHCNPSLIRGSDHFIVTNASSWLYNRSNSRCHSGVKAISEWKECIACADATIGTAC